VRRSFGDEALAGVPQPGARLISLDLDVRWHESKQPHFDGMSVGVGIRHDVTDTCSLPPPLAPPRTASPSFFGGPLGLRRRGRPRRASPRPRGQLSRPRVRRRGPGLGVGRRRGARDSSADHRRGLVAARCSTLPPPPCHLGPAAGHAALRATLRATGDARNSAAPAPGPPPLARLHRVGARD
jgi:hypothetical protein